jgi:hypothetical protein
VDSGSGHFQIHAPQQTAPWFSITKSAATLDAVGSKRRTRAYERKQGVGFWFA